MIPFLPLLIGGGLIALAVITISKLKDMIKRRFGEAFFIKVLSNKIKTNLDNGNAKTFNVLGIKAYDCYGNKLGKDEIRGNFDTEVQNLRRGDVIYV